MRPEATDRARRPFAPARAHEARSALILDIGQGAGLSAAAGVRPFLPPLLAGALARGDVGLDFDGTDFAFLESEAFLLAVLAGAVGWYMAERSRANQRAVGDQQVAEGPGRGSTPLLRDPVRVLTVALGVVLGALLFAGSLAAGGESGWPGLAGGAICALLATAASGPLFARARARLDRSAAALLPVYADGIAIALAAVAIALPPLSFVALAGFVVLLVRGPGRGREKYAGLRMLR